MNDFIVSNYQVWPITFLASILIWLMFGGLLVLWIFDGRIKREQALHAFAAALLAWVVTQVLKSLLPMTRPFVLNGEPALTLTAHADASFPSSHSAMAFSLAVTMWLHNRKLGFFYLVAAFLVGIGRVFAHVHYLLDIVTGGLLGGLVAVIVSRFHPRT